MFEIEKEGNRRKRERKRDSITPYYIAKGKGRVKGKEKRRGPRHGSHLPTNLDHFTLSIRSARGRKRSKKEKRGKGKKKRKKERSSKDMICYSLLISSTQGPRQFREGKKLRKKGRKKDKEGGSAPL